MDRNVPRTGSEEIELYIRTYYSLLRSSDEVQIKSLAEAHAQMDSSLHPLAREAAPDMSALIYSSLRLPACIRSVRLVVLGQTREVFERHGYTVGGWQAVGSRARRRRCFFDEHETLAAFIASHSDIDDLIPQLTALQIEWNKLHLRLRGRTLPGAGEAREAEALAHMLDVAPDDLERLRAAWGADFLDNLRAMQAAPKRFSVRLLSGSLTDYRRATLAWYEHIERTCAPAFDLRARPVYFVSSNTHSLINLLSGFALRREAELVHYIHEAEHTDLLDEWNDIEARHVPSSRENFLYYVLKKYVRAPEGRAAARDRLADEAACGLRRILSEPYSFDVDAQVFELRSLKPEWMDSRLCLDNMPALARSEALVFNIDYPLGMNAYLILSQVASRVGEVRGLYVMGKAATLNGAIGDMMLPNVVYDEQSRNTYLFSNCFAAHDVSPHLVYGTVLDNQKAVAVRGTFLQNARYTHVFYKENYTDIEMETGPYLCAAFELFKPKRYPLDEIVDLHPAPFDLGVIHYASDKPLSKGKNLGAANLSYFGMDPTYAASIAILRRIFGLEIQRHS